MIVSGVRKIGSVAGKVLDAEDRRVVGMGLVYLLALGLAIITVAGAAGLALNVFEAARDLRWVS